MTHPHRTPKPNWSRPPVRTDPGAPMRFPARPVVVDACTEAAPILRWCVGIGCGNTSRKKVGRCV